MKNPIPRPTSAMILGLALALPTASPAQLAARAGNEALKQIVLDLKASALDYQELRERGQVEFADPRAELTYQRALRRLDQSIRRLEDLGGGGGQPPVNERGRAVVLIRQQLPANQATAVIAELPDFVSTDDLSFLGHGAQEVPGTSLPALVRAYYLQGSRPHLANRKGKAGRSLLQHLAASHRQATLAALPGFLNQSDADFVDSLAQQQMGSRVEGNLRAYFTHPSSLRPGNVKGAAGLYLLEKIFVTHQNACLEALPEYVDGSELDPFRQLVDATTPSRLPQALREFFSLP